MMLKTTLIVSILLKICETSNILYVMPFSAKSHYIGMKDLALELAARGHEVYAITPYKEEIHPPTYHQLLVEPKSIWNFFFDKRPNVFTIADYSFTEFQTFLFNSAFVTNELVFNSTDVQQFLKEDHKIDAVICEIFFNEGTYMFAHKYQAPLILMSTFGNSFKTNFFSRNPLQLSTVYHEYGYSLEPTSFIGRLYNLYYCIYDLVMLKYWYLPRLQEEVTARLKGLPEPVPSLEELSGNAALVLMNSHFSVDTPTAYLPNFIEVPGLHIKETKTKNLSKDLQKLLDNANNGAVLLSFGSNVHTSELDENKVNAFLKVFGELNQTVLMKWEDTTLPNVPKNVILRNWFPQREVLAHPNIKLFIGHGGWLGLQETIAAGVPIIGVPVFGDQYLNVANTVQNGHGTLLRHTEINEETLRKIINNMLNDKKYLKKAKQIAARFKDRPMSGLDTAVWWTEYVIRHKGAEFMKAPTLQMNYFAYQMLDIYLCLITLIFIALYLVYKSVSFLKKLLSKSRGKKQKEH